ncbi:superoxide dismutase family protein [Paenibacillus cymbidii]|uniref:superoxide dismutase family protein n=1 Tax=Paenibacillus cymbidii TaxID=1639034 RepID=UPI001F253DE9|nr:superoxide dismutase family protein [Paenibacillus cymbidii]
MRNSNKWLAAICFAALAGCSSTTGASVMTGGHDGHGQHAEPAAPLAAKANIINGKGETIGMAEFAETPAGVQIRLQVSGLTPGIHGFHIHAKGKCDIPDFKTAGDHFNPQMKKHGFHNPQGPHAGDLPNINVGSDGKATAEAIDKRVTLVRGKPNSLLNSEGTSLVIHADPDDYQTDPAGNSGARVACGVIG